MQQCLFVDLPLISKEGETKCCTKCKQQLPLSHFGTASGGSYLRSECKKCNTLLRATTKRLKRLHDAPDADYVCPICNQNAQELNSKGPTWVIDHDHETHEFRGWLCQKCNRGLGAFNDNPETLTRAIGYLYGTSTKTKDETQ